MNKNSYSYNFKLAAMSFYLQKNNTIKKTLNLFKISNGSLFNWLKLKSLNQLHIKKCRKKHNTKLLEVIQYIIRYVLKYKRVYCNRLINLIDVKYKKTISRSSIYRILKNNNITRKKIKKRIIIKNKRKLNKLKNIFKQKINNIDKNKIISIDETSIDTHISSNYGWEIIGKPIFRIENKQRVRYSVICAITNKKVIYYKVIKGSANRYDFLNFIKKVVEVIKNNNYYFLLDNARIHHAKIFKAFIELNQINVIYNVPYCPENNPIEKAFFIVKNNLRNKKNNDVSLLKNIKSSFKKVTHTQLDSFYKKSLTFT